MSAPTIIIPESWFNFGFLVFCFGLGAGNSGERIRRMEMSSIRVAFLFLAVLAVGCGKDSSPKHVMEAYIETSIRCNDGETYDECRGRGKALLYYASHQPTTTVLCNCGLYDNNKTFCAFYLDHKHVDDFIDLRDTVCVYLQALDSGNKEMMKKTLDKLRKSVEGSP